MTARLAGRGYEEMEKGREWERKQGLSGYTWGRCWPSFHIRTHHPGQRPKFFEYIHCLRGRKLDVVARLRCHIAVAPDVLGVPLTQEILARGGEINFTGFGKFAVADRSARQSVNPQTGERIQIAASRVPSFSAGSGLKSARY